jgi:polysaccharide biosynthesis protein VpsM
MIKQIRYCSYTLFSAFFLLQPLQVNGAEQYALAIDDITLVAQNDILPPAASSRSTDEFLLPEGGTTDLGDDLFGTPGGGYVHPFLTISGEYTDNLFNNAEDTRNNFLTSIAPGIWMSVPQTKEVPSMVNPNNTTAGGLQMALPYKHSFDRINAYLLGALDFLYYSENSDLNNYDARLEGLFQLNLRGGFSARIVDRYTRGHDVYDVGNLSFTMDEFQRYDSNVAMATIDWDFSEKFRTKVEYSNYLLDYKHINDAFMDRTDNAVSLYGYYKYSPKTSLFLQYQYIDLDYDSANLQDNEQNYFYGGFNWESSAKTSLRFKAGYQEREYKNSIVDKIANHANDFSNDTFSFELSWLYQISQKTGFTVAANHKIEETDSSVELNKKVLAGLVQYHQQLTEKLYGTLALSYENADYSQFLGPKRDDDRYMIRPALQYVFRDWLEAELSYKYDSRSSSVEIFDYDTNTIYLGLKTAL